MNPLLSQLLSLFRPEEEALSLETRLQVQVHRLLCILGIGFPILFGFLYQVSIPEATDPWWARLSVAGLFGGLLAASYASRQVRRRYPVWMRRVLYLVVGWFVALAAVNHFTGNYTVGLLVVFAVLLLVVSRGARSLGPVLWFSGVALFLTAGAAAAETAPRTSPLILLTCMAMVVFVEVALLPKQLWTLEKLFEQEEQLRAITENVSEGIYRVELGEGLIYANQAFAEMFGYESSEAVQEVDPASLYDDPSERERRLDLRRETDAFDGHEIEFQRKDGTTFTGLLNGTVVRGEEGEVKYYDGAIADITERKERVAQLKRQNERLDSFASLVSHDLRNPLNVAEGRLTLAREELGVEEEGAAHLAAVERALGRMDTIIEDVLVLTWGKQKLDEEDVGTHRLGQVTKACWQNVDTAQATLEVEDDPLVEAEENRVRRLLENLFRNAIEHGEEEVKVRVGALDDGFYVEDGGPGIPEEKRDEVFEAGHSSEETGTGLGLSIVTSIAEAHGWAVSVGESEEGGARFEITGVEEPAE